MNGYQLKILTPDKKVYAGEVVSLTVICENGQLTVLAGHAPMAAALVEGPLTLKTARETIQAVAGHGILQVDRNQAAVMVHSFHWAGDEMAEYESANDTAADDWMR